jgi:hypothetical protein
VPLPNVKAARKGRRRKPKPPEPLMWQVVKYATLALAATGALGSIGAARNLLS